MSNVNDLTTGKQISILAVALGCFSVLWPTIFQPMLVGTVNNYQSKEKTFTFDNEEGVYASAMDRERGIENFLKRRKLTPRQFMQSERSTAGSGDDTAGGVKKNDTSIFSILMPIYTAVVTIFLAYSLAKLLYTRWYPIPPCTEPLVCDFHMSTAERECRLYGRQRSVRPVVAACSDQRNVSATAAGARAEQASVARSSAKSAETVESFRERLESAEQTLGLMVNHLADLMDQVDQLGCWDCQTECEEWEDGQIVSAECPYIDSDQ